MLDHELADEQDELDADILKVLRRPSIPSVSATALGIRPPSSGNKHAATRSSAHDDEDGAPLSPPRAPDDDDTDVHVQREFSDVRASEAPAGLRSSDKKKHIDSSAGPVTDDGEEDIPTAMKAPDAAMRYQKAKLKMQAKQLEELQEIRRRMSEQVDDLQRQLKNEREENKKHKKRYADCYHCLNQPTSC